MDQGWSREAHRNDKGVFVIFLIGVTHSVQDYRSVQRFGRETANLIEDFKSFVHRIIRANSITALAEEYQEYLDGKRTHSVLAEIARSCDPILPHCYCDPDSEERGRMGIPTRVEIERAVLKSLGLNYKSFHHYKSFGDCCVPYDLVEKRIKKMEMRYWSQREAFWLDKVGERIQGNILFVVGACHIKSFTALIKHRGHEAHCIAANWGKGEGSPSSGALQGL